MKHSLSRNQASILVWTVLTIAILSIVAAEVIRIGSIKYQNSLQATQWQEALTAAESGVDLGIVELRKALYPPSLYPNFTSFPTASATPAGSWDGPPTTSGTAGGQETITFSDAGLAGTAMTIDVKVDKPSEILDSSTNPPYQYYRIRSTGTLPLTGPARVSDNKQDSKLRRLSLRAERFTNGILFSRELTTPQVSRRIEAIVKPVSSFNLAIMSVGQLDLRDRNIVIDSYDSRDVTKSTNGLYPNDDRNPDGTLKRQENGDIATNGDLIRAGNAEIHGDVFTNSGTVTGTGGITGEQRTDFYQEPIPVAAPTGFPGSSSTINTTATLYASTSQSSPARYVLNSITLNGNDTLTLQAPTGTPSGTTTYIEIYVTGDIAVTGNQNAQIEVVPGVKATIYFAGNVAIAGRGIVNGDNQPGNLLLYGIKPPPNTSQSVSLGGNAQLSAALYAPNADVQINGSGSNGEVSGSIVGKTVVMTGVTNLHYDEALGDGGLINNYSIVSWVEDNR